VVETLKKSYQIISVTVVLVLMLLVHVYAFLLEEISPDMETWLTVGESAKNGQDFYSATRSDVWHLPYWYPPLWGIVLGGIGLIVDPVLDPTLYLFITRSILMAGDVAVGLILLRASRGSLLHFGFWMLNPLVIGVAQSGQFDVLAVLFSLLAYTSHKERRGPLTGVLIGLGFSFKFWPILFLPLFLADYRENGSGYAKNLVFATLATSIAVSFPFALTTEYLTSVIDMVGYVRILLAILSLFLLHYVSRKLGSSLLSISCFTVTLLLIVLPNHIQYALWLMPFLLLYMVEHPSKMLAVLANVLWIAHFLQRYNVAILKVSGLDVTFPTAAFDVIYLAILAYVVWRLCDRRLVLGCDTSSPVKL